MTITYQVKNSIYVNMTNRCPCACTFCLRQNGPGVYGSAPLWLEREPTVEETCDSLAAWGDLAQYDEVVFCGYGEPTERLDDLLKVAAWLKAHYAVSIRINTNGLTDLIWGEPCAPKLTGLIDCVSISLNATNAEAYNAVCRPKFGLPSYQAMLDFTKACSQTVPKVMMTVVGEPVTTQEEQAVCREICASVGAQLRVRPYES